MDSLRELRAKVTAKNRDGEKEASRFGKVQKGLRAGREFVAGAPFVAITANEGMGRPVTGEDVSWAADQAGEAFDGGGQDPRSRIRQLRQQSSHR